MIVANTKTQSRVHEARLNYLILFVRLLARVKEVQALRDGSLDLEARIITAIGAVGPRNIAEIARLTGAHQETIRYDVKTRLARLGFRYHAEIDWDKLGLTQHWATLHFSPRYAGSELEIFEAMNKACYLTYYTKVLPQGKYLTIFSLPSGQTNEFKSFLKRLCERGILADFSLDEVVLSRHPPMNPKFFNFRSGRWEVEWDRVRREPARPLPLEKKVGVSLADYYDLLLIKELQKDARQQIVGIARKLKLSDKTLEYHYRAHVLGHRLIRSFIVRWAQDIEKKLSHSVAFTRMTFKRLEEGELKKIQGAMSKVPFLWAEDLLRDGTYVATLYIPVEEALGTLSYINDEVPYLDTKVEIGYLKPRESYLYTIPHNMYVDGKWTFDAQRMESALVKAVARIFAK
jgi:DNA-binding Lrp family transcriptional regulator